ncbi:hypothetical protein AB434_2881 [Heyndrickxia coagulans]|uniref:Uncharacterized protein n=1 Tax=Heyndrickxia coagulans TaxID=1398 RepID=A0A0C5CCG3_HEYCO|nr:hypothetical protein SB48_HM08orf03830 [Heyndrickxia coagulans]AKN55286.1 hypothetical protein AB434_2881 [Heyndrickxia coagulans]KWZ76169.1 hypothetical protein HMPREF3213_03922 [Heyndrickxia coagulans]KYC59103.1 hypothetical protein B4100_3604 [Heyndrickxia coagulans]KYC69519.1 hypothetical protein B4096_3493 [Heyndrickxia coagulans]
MKTIPYEAICLQAVQGKVQHRYPGQPFSVPHEIALDVPLNLP